MRREFVHRGLRVLWQFRVNSKHFKCPCRNSALRIKSKALKQLLSAAFTLQLVSERFENQLNREGRRRWRCHSRECRVVFVEFRLFAKCANKRVNSCWASPSSHLPTVPFQTFPERWFVFRNQWFLGFIGLRLLAAFLRLFSPPLWLLIPEKRCFG